MNDIPAAKIKMMKGSIRCLIFGLLGLLPIIGLPFALAALWVSGRVRARKNDFGTRRGLTACGAWLVRRWGRWSGALLTQY